MLLSQLTTSSQLCKWASNFNSINVYSAEILRAYLSCFCSYVTWSPTIINSRKCPWTFWSVTEPIAWVTWNIFDNLLVVKNSLEHCEAKLMWNLFLENEVDFKIWKITYLCFLYVSESWFNGWAIFIGNACWQEGLDYKCYLPILCAITYLQSKPHIIVFSTSTNHCYLHFTYLIK